MKTKHSKKGSSWIFVKPANFASATLSQGLSSLFCSPSVPLVGPGVIASISTPAGHHSLNVFPPERYPQLPTHHNISPDVHHWCCCSCLGLVPCCLSTTTYTASSWFSLTPIFFYSIISKPQCVWSLKEHQLSNSLQIWAGEIWNTQTEESFTCLSSSEAKKSFTSVGGTKEGWGSFS